MTDQREGRPSPRAGIVVESDSLDGGWIASHPDWPGIVAQGDTAQDAGDSWWEAWKTAAEDAY